MPEMSSAQPRCFFSKNGEDYLLWTFFGRKTPGFFLDIGAYDGCYMSNTYLFELQGWRGICVEPHPESFRLCQKNRPGSRCIQAACTHSDKNQTIRFFAEKTGLLSTTMDTPAIHQDIQNRYQQKKMEFPGFKEIQVPAQTVTEILTQFAPDIKSIDFISIDTEGSELKVLQGIDFSRFNIRVIVVEANTESAETAVTHQLQKSGGFQLARKVKVNLFFVKNRQDANALASIPIRCRLAKQIHPLVPSFTPAKLQGPRTLNEKIPPKKNE
jgi:FkbM family methyltransferase